MEPTIACTLTRSGLADQAAAWRRLRTAAELAVEMLDDGVRLRFRAGPGVAQELRRLTAIENECCSWAAWTVHEHTGEAILDVRSEGDGIAAVRALFT
jgi:hypothetical protein